MIVFWYSKREKKLKTKNEGKVYENIKKFIRVLYNFDDSDLKKTKKVKR